MTRRLTIFVLMMGLGASALSAGAQDAKTEREKKAEARKLAQAAETRIDKDMTNMTNLVEAMSKNMGQLHHIRTMCFGRADQRWRNYAAQMMDIEAKDDPAQHQELVRAFNAGFYEQQTRSTVCDSSATIEAAALSENGRRLANMLSDPYRER